MRSYQDHLSNLIIKKNLKIIKKPVLRSSAIFPFFLGKQLDTKITFLGYWFLKRKIKEVSVSITIRNKKGLELYYFNTLVNKTKSYEYSVKELLKNVNIKKVSEGSIEIEINSTKDLVFPFPAITISIVNSNSITFVHTCGRIFNNFHDKAQNTKNHVPESGFDLIPNKNVKPFFSFVNGPNKLINSNLKLILINQLGEKIYEKIKINEIQPYETKIINILNKKKRKFLNNKKGSIKIFHDFKDFFPRFMCGAIDNNKKFSTLTHSYYDLSSSKDKKIDLWKNPNHNIFFDSATSVPLFFLENKYTEFVIYPNYIKKKLSIKFEIFDFSGKNKNINYMYNLKKKPDRPIYLNLTNIFNKLSNDKLKENYFARVSTIGEGETPTRLKFGLNIGENKKKYNFTSNICFNTNIPVSNIVNKKASFKWSSIFPTDGFEFFISNISYLKKGFKDANLKLTFWDQDFKSYSKKIIIKDNGFFRFQYKKNTKLKKFLKNKTGWVTIQADNPFINGYYINFGNNGVVGADHLY